MAPLARFQSAAFFYRTSHILITLFARAVQRYHVSWHYSLAKLCKKWEGLVSFWVVPFLLLVFYHNRIGIINNMITVHMAYQIN